jgi:hypothetical protein
MVLSEDKKLEEAAGISGLVGPAPYSGKSAPPLENLNISENNIISDKLGQVLSVFIN